MSSNVNECIVCLQGIVWLCFWMFWRVWQTSPPAQRQVLTSVCPSSGSSSSHPVHSSAGSDPSIKLSGEASFTGFVKLIVKGVYQGPLEFKASGRRGPHCFLLLLKRSASAVNTNSSTVKMTNSSVQKTWRDANGPKKYLKQDTFIYIAHFIIAECCKMLNKITTIMRKETWIFKQMNRGSWFHRKTSVTLLILVTTEGRFKEPCQWILNTW